MENRSIENELDAWLMFFSSEDPERIIELINKYPMFRKMYDDIYELCRNMEKVMGMFSKELRELDRNTVQYMIDELQATIDAQAAALEADEKRYEKELEAERKRHDEELEAERKEHEKELERERLKYAEALKCIEELKRKSGSDPLK